MAWGKPHTSGNPKRRRWPAKRPKKVVTWANGQDYGLARRERPERYQNPGRFTSSFKERLVIGAPIMVAVPLEKYQTPTYPFIQLRQSYNAGYAHVMPGMLLIYAGTVRVKERARVAGQTVDMEVPKHTFIVPNIGRCIIHDLALIKHA